jgi:hypothetical protein
LRIAIISIQWQFNKKGGNSIQWQFNKKGGNKFPPFLLKE